MLNCIFQVRPIGEAELMVLTAGQVFVMFGLLLIAIVFSLGCLIIEMLHLKSKNIRGSSGQKKLMMEEDLIGRINFHRKLRQRRRSLH